MNLSDYPLLADENIHPKVVAHLRTIGLDIVDANSAGIVQRDDASILALALSQKRVILTHDADFGRLAVHRGHQVVGIVYLRPGHIVPKMTIASLSAVIGGSLDLQAPFIVVAVNDGDRISMRFRSLD